jgi:signal transduction histidine kinase
VGAIALQDFVAHHRDEIIRRCRTKVAGRTIPPPSADEIDRGVPLFLDQLVEALRAGSGSTLEMSRGAILHGHDLLRQGFTVSQVVHDYGDVCQSVTELAMETGTDVSVGDFRTLNQCLDEAIACAVGEYGRGRTQSGVEIETARGTERLGFLAHELRNLINTATIAFDVLKTGNVGVGGSTGTVLYRSLMGLDALVTRSLAEVRLTQGIQNREQIRMSDFVQEIAAAATLDAEAREITLVVTPVQDNIAVGADRQVLSAVVHNLLQNAFKFTRPGTTVILRAGASADRVLIEVEDACGGLPDDDGRALFRPFEQRSADRTGLGLGLAFSRWAAEANDGRIYARNLPGKGCIFTVDLPRAAVPAVEMV